MRTGVQVVAERTVTATTGETVNLPCRRRLETRVVWYLSELKPHSVISVNDNIRDRFRDRFTIDTFVFGEHNLTIRNVNRKDEGKYVCQEVVGIQSAMEHWVLLNVSGKSHYAVESQNAFSKSWKLLGKAHIVSY